MLDFETTQNEIASDNKIVLKAVFGKQQGKLILHPVSDQRTGRLMGVPLLSEDEQRKAVVIINRDTKLVIEDDFIFNLNESVDNAHWNWVQHCPTIAESFEDSQRSDEALFYVQDVEREISKKLSKHKLVAKASSLIEETSKTKWYDIARLMGNRMDYAKPLEVEEYLYNMASTNPEKLIRAFNDPNGKVKIFFYNLADKRIVRHENGVYSYGDVKLGISEDQAILWMQDAKNIELIEAMKRDLYPEYMPAINMVDNSVFEVKAESKTTKKG